MLISKDGRVCISDFGFAKKIEEDNVGENMDVVGTPYWCKIFKKILFFNNFL